MPISGTGTSSDPFMVHTALELRYALTATDAYVKLANHIDCDVDCPKWKTLNVGAVDLELNNFDILKIYAVDDTIVFNKVGGRFTIHGGRILNLTMVGSVFNVSNYGNEGVDEERYNNVLVDVGISLKATGCGTSGYLFNRGTYFNRCNVGGDKSGRLGVETTLPNASHHVFSISAIASAGVLFDDSWLALHTNNQDASSQTYPFGFAGNFRNSRVEAKTDIECPFGNYALGIDSSATSSIFELKGNPNHQFNYLSASSSGVNPFNAGEMTITSTRASEIPCSTAQMRNSAYLNSVGFYNQGVG